MKYKLSLVLTITMAMLSQVMAQTTPPIQWQKCLGGSLNDDAYAVHQTSDGGYIVAGKTFSIDGDVTGHGNPNIEDAWAVKLNSSGSIVWEKAFGGYGGDYFSDCLEGLDGSLYFFGQTVSNDALITDNHGLQDFYLVKTDASGNLIWQKCYGGSNYDYSESITQGTDGSIYLVGESKSSDGQLTGNHGYNDAWVVKIDGAGNLIWQNNYGGSLDDRGVSVAQAPDGNLVFCGNSYSNDGDLTSNYGLTDAWFMKLNSSNGSKIWSYSYGGSGNDAVNAMTLTSENLNISLVAVGYTDSPNDYNVTGNHGGEDFWLLTVDGNNGIFNFSQCYGGSLDDVAYSVSLTYDGGYLLNGVTYSIDGQITNHGNPAIPDYWAVKLNRGCTIDWSNCFGGSALDAGLSGEETNDGGYVLSGWTASNDIDVSGNHGADDFWVVKLDPCFIPPTSTAFITPSTPTCGSTATMSVPGGIPYSYQWKKNGSNISGATGRIYTATTKGDYTCTVTNGQCGSITSSNTIHNQKPVATISPSGTVNKCAADLVNFSANTGANLTYQWYKGSSAIAGATNSTYSTSNSGKFKVTVYNTETQCSKTSSKTTVNNICKSLDEPNVPVPITLYPNPADGYSKIDFNNNTQIREILILDLTGRIIYTYNLSKDLYSSSIDINTASLNSGIYFCKVIYTNHDSVCKTIKFIVQHN